MEKHTAQHGWRLVGWGGGGHLGGTSCGKCGWPPVPLLEFLLSWGDFSISIAPNHRLIERVSKAAPQNNNCALFASCSVPKCPPRKALHSSTVLLPGVSKRLWSGRSLLRIGTESSYQPHPLHQRYNYEQHPQLRAEKRAGFIASLCVLFKQTRQKSALALFLRSWLFERGSFDPYRCQKTSRLVSIALASHFLACLNRSHA